MGDEAPLPIGSAYRSAAVRRTVRFRVGYARRTLAVSLVAATLLAVAGGLAWFRHATVEVKHREWVTEGCENHVLETVEMVPLSLAWLRGTRMPPGKVAVREAVAVHASPSGNAVFLLVLALVALAGPLVMTERAAVTLDEGEGVVRLEKQRFGITALVERPLAELLGAELAQQGWSRTARLRFRSGTIDVAAPSTGDAGHAALVAGVEEFLKIPS